MLYTPILFPVKHFGIVFCDPYYNAALIFKINSASFLICTINKLKNYVSQEQLCNMITDKGTTMGVHLFNYRAIILDINPILLYTSNARRSDYIKDSIQCIMSSNKVGISDDVSYDTILNDALGYPLATGDTILDFCTNGNNIHISNIISADDYYTSKSVILIRDIYVADHINHSKPFCRGDIFSDLSVEHGTRTLHLDDNRVLPLIISNAYPRDKFYTKGR